MRKRHSRYNNPESQIFDPPITGCKMLEFTLCLFGIEKVGKTSIINRLKDNSFEQEYKETTVMNDSTTILKIVNYNNIYITLIDIPGQEKYRVINKEEYLQRADCIMLVYSIDNRDSFERLKERSSDIKYIEEKYNKKITIILVGNKSDLYSNEEVSEEEAKQYAQLNGYCYSLISCKDNLSIDNAINKLLSKFLNINI